MFAAPPPGTISISFGSMSQSPPSPFGAVMSGVRAITKVSRPEVSTNPPSPPSGPPRALNWPSTFANPSANTTTLPPSPSLQRVGRDGGVRRNVGRFRGGHGTLAALVPADQHLATAVGTGGIDLRAFKTHLPRRATEWSRPALHSPPRTLRRRPTWSPTCSRCGSLRRTAHRPQPGRSASSVRSL